MLRLVLILATGLAATVKAYAGPCDGTTTVPALVTVNVVDESFVIRITSQSVLNQAISICNGQAPPRIVNGFLRTGNGGYNHDPQNETIWSWHLREETIELAENSIELCDGRPSYVEGDLREWFTNVGQFCPWASQITAILPDTSVNGDFNIDSQVDALEASQFMACFDGSGTPCYDLAGGCCATDMDGDQAIDCEDWELLRNAWTDPQEPPFFAYCPGSIPTISVNGVALLFLGILIGGALVASIRRRSA